MKLNRKVGATSEIWQIFIQDSSSTTGGGLTGLAFNSGSLVAYYHRDTDTTATAISLVTMTVGTFTSSGFKEIDSTNMPGWYQFCPPNTALASGAKSCAFHLKGATNMAPLPIEVDLDSQVDVSKWNGTAVPAENTAGYPLVDTAKLSGTPQTARDLGAITANTITHLNQIYDTDYATIYDTTNKAFLAKLGNFAMGGSSLALTTGAIACTTITASGAVAFQSTFVVTTSTNLGALSCSTLTASGAVAFQSTFAVTTSTSFAALSFTTLTASGAVAFQSTFTTSGTTTLNALTVTNATNLTGAVTFGSTWGVTGAVTFTAGLTSNITGNLSGSVSSVTGAVGSVTAAVTLSAADGQTVPSGTGTAAAGGSSSITLQTALGADTLPVGSLIKITSGTGSGQTRVISAYINSTKVVTVGRAWVTNPDNTSVYAITYNDATKIDSSLKVSGVVLVDTLSTYTNNTVQTGDSFARIGSTGSGLTSLAQASAWTSSLATNLGTLAGHDPGATLGTSTLTQTQVTGGAYSVQSASCVLGDARIANLDATITSRTKPADTQAAVALVTTTMNLTNLPAAPTDWISAAAVSAAAVTKIQAGLSTYAGGDTAGTTTLLSRIGGAITISGGKVAATMGSADYSGNTVQTGDAYTRIGATGSGLTSLAQASAWTSALATNLGTLAGHDPGATLGTSTLTQTQVTGGAYSVQNASCVLGDARVANLDAAITSRSATGDAMTLTSGERTTLAAVIWAALTSGLTTAGSIGKRLADFVTTLVYSTPPTAAANATAVWTDTISSDFTTTSSPGKILVTQLGGIFTTTSSSILTTGSLANAPGAGSAPTAAQNAAAVWDLATSGHTATGTFGAAMSAASSAGDPWATALPGSYPSGEAGYIIGTALANAAARINASSITITVGTLPSPLSQDFSLVAGDDYRAADGNGLTFNAITTLDLSTAAVSLVIYRGTVEGSGTEMSLTMSVSTITGGFALAHDLTATQTTALGLIAKRRYEIKATLSNSHVKTLLSGTVTTTP